jgi:hypothetical protein
MFTGFAVAIIWQNAFESAINGVEVYNLPLAFLCALVVNVIISLLVPGRAVDARAADTASA